MRDLEADQENPWRDEAILRHLYQQRDLTTDEIASELGCSESTVSDWLREYDLTDYDPDRPTPWRDSDRLRELYIEREMTMEEMADHFDVGIDAIHRWMKRHDIPRRSRGRTGWENDTFLPFAPFDTKKDGYERWVSNFNNTREEVRVHRLLAVAKYGFDAVSGELIHHKNGIKWDNRPENIELMTREEHGRHHVEEGDFRLNNVNS